MKNNGSDWKGYWDEEHGTGALLEGARNWLGGQLCRYFQKQVEIPGQKPRSMEAGSGSAVVSALLAKEGWRCFALDIEPLALQAARRVSPTLSLVQADLYRSCFQEGSFDLVWNNSTLEHLPDPLQALRKMAELARPGGYVFTGVPYTYGPLSVFKLKKESFGGTWDGTTFSKRKLKWMFQKAGLEPVDSRCFFFFCFAGMLGRKR